MTIVSTDWNEWHAAYDDPQSSLSRRLGVVRQQLATIVDAREPGPMDLVSLCAGDGRDVLPVLAGSRTQVSAVLVEIDPTLSSVARRTARRSALPCVEVRIADAGRVDTYAGVPPADVLLACGVFGNVTDADVRSTVQALPRLLAPNATVIWTRGDRDVGDLTTVDGDPADMVRSVFAEYGFAEEVFVRPDDARFRVGVHRFTGEPEPRAGGGTMFSFVR